MKNASRWNGIAVLAAATLALTGCGGPSGPSDAGDRPASLAVSAAFTGSPGDVSASIQDAFLAADSLDIELFRIVNDRERVLLSRTLAFDPAGGQMSVPLEVSLDDSGDTWTLSLGIRRGPDQLFRGSTEVTLRPGLTSQAEVTLEPVAAAVEASPDSVTFTALSDTARAAAAVLFATGDTIPPTELRSPGVTWFSRDTLVVEALDDGRLVSTYFGSTVVDVYYGAGRDSVLVEVTGQVQ